MRRSRLALAAALLLTAGGCAIGGQVETSTVQIENGTAEITSRRVRGAIRCEPGPAPGTPCRAEVP